MTTLQINFTTLVLSAASLALMTILVGCSRSNNPTNLAQHIAYSVVVANVEEVGDLKRVTLSVVDPIEFKGRTIVVMGEIQPHSNLVKVGKKMDFNGHEHFMGESYGLSPGFFGE